MRLGGTLVLLLVDSDEPVVWLVAWVVPVWFEVISLARSLSDSFAESALIRRLREVVRNSGLAAQVWGDNDQDEDGSGLMDEGDEDLEKDLDEVEKLGPGLFRGPGTFGGLGDGDDVDDDGGD